MKIFIISLLGLIHAADLTAASLHDAVVKGDLVRMQSILNQNPRAVNELNAEGETPLHSAALTGQSMSVQFLLANGADVNARNPSSGSTPLLAAAMMGHQTVAEILLAGGANVNLPSRQGTTPLHVAAYQGHLPMVEFLLARGANVNLKDQTGLTPIQWALITDKKEIARLLLDADPELPGRTTPTLPTRPAPDDSEIVKLREQILALTRALRDSEHARQSAAEEIERDTIKYKAQIQALQDELERTRTENQRMTDDLTTRLTQANEQIADMERKISLLINQTQTKTAEINNEELKRLKGRMASITMAMKEADINRQMLNAEITKLKTVMIQIRERLQQLQALKTNERGR